MEFDTWAATLKADGQWLGPIKSIVRGSDWGTTIAFAEDLSAGTFTGAVKLNPKADSPLASFDIVVGAYIDGETEIGLSLTSGDVDAMPSDDDGNYVEEVVFYILEDGELFAAGTIPVLDLET